jgi:hypothetical protein
MVVRGYDGDLASLLICLHGSNSEGPNTFAFLYDGLVLTDAQGFEIRQQTKVLLIRLKLTWLEMTTSEYPMGLVEQQKSK